MKKIPFDKPFLVGKELEYAARAASEKNLSGDGSYTVLCHKWFEENFETPKALLTPSCTAALELAAITAGIGPGDEVIMPSYTFASTANAFALRGAVPVFIDIHERNLNMNENLLEAAITEKTKAIVPVHYAGVACEMDRIMKIADENDLVVIEDAAQGVYSKYKEKYQGTIGHFGCLSFHETKNISSGEGGALFINDEKYIQKAEITREKGTNRTQFFRGEVDKYSWMELGSSYLPSDLIAAFLYAQLEEIDKIINKRRLNCRIYDSRLADKLSSIGVSTAEPLNQGEYNGHIYYLLCRNLEERNALIAHLKSKGIGAVFHYVPLHSAPAGKKYCRTGSSMDVTDSASSRIVRLPMFYELPENDINLVCDEIFEFFDL